MPSFTLLDLGTAANDGTGDDLRTAGKKINDVITYINANSPSVYEKHSSDMTAKAGQMIFADTSSNPFTVTLPASPVFGDTVDIVDYAATWATNNLTVKYDGTNKVNRLTSNYVLNTNDGNIKLTYVDTTVGWLVVRK